jgi:hypothetical protein
MAFADPLPPTLTDVPQVRFSGSIDQAALSAFHSQLAAVEPGDGAIVFEVSKLRGRARHLFLSPRAGRSTAG